MSKQSIVKEAKVLEKDGGKKSYVVTFEDGVNGFYEIKECGELKQGDHVDYTVEEKTSKAGKKYNTITVTKTTGESKPTPPPQPSKPQSSPAPIRDDYWQKLKYETRVPIARLIMDAVIAGKIETSQDEFKSWYNALTAQVDASIDEIR
jgi:hypothetical protein